MKKKYLGVAAVISLVLAAVAYLYVPTLAQPGDANDPLVTRRYVDDRMAQMSEEIAILRNIIASIAPGAVQPTLPPGGGTGLTSSERDALFGEIMLYFETMYGDLLRQAAVNAPGAAQVVPFEVLNVPAGRRITFEAGVEFIVRSGGATVVAGENGIVDATAGRDVPNGQAVGLNHLMLVPQTDGRGLVFTSDSWIMVKGRYHITN